MSASKGSYISAESTNSFRDTADFFPVAKGNLTKITWAHGVNSQKRLNDALNNTIMMLEADVVLGRVNGEQSDIPIMGHPPQTTSDISLQDFLQKIHEHNKNENNTAKKGVKLDFKTIEVFKGSVDIVQKLYPEMDYPVWLNADILPGPVNATSLPVNATQFIELAKPFENSTLSIGWKTFRRNDTSNNSYTEEHINEMINVINENNVTQLITFPVRAAMAAESITQLQSIISKVKNSTLTLWNGQDDEINIENLRKLIATVGVDKVYIDLPEEIKDKLRLDKLPGGAGMIKPLAIIPLISITLMKLL